MAKKKLKLFLVKREVMATSIERAASARGVIYAIELAKDEHQPNGDGKQIGFRKKK